jgi:hypothetical protein
MSTKLTKAASILAFVIGAMAVASGGRVILGHVPDYYVIDWVPIYNFTVGLISAAVLSILIWKNHKYALGAAITTLASHSTVLVILLAAYRQTVAPDSIVAMLLRITVWTIILSLLLIQGWKYRGLGRKKVAL